MAHPQKLAISPFFILLWIHLLFNILVSGWLIFTGQGKEHEAFLYLASISTIVLLIVLLITTIREPNLQTTRKSTTRKVLSVFLLLFVHFIVSCGFAVVGECKLCWISVIDIALMIVFLTTTKIYV